MSKNYEILRRAQLTREPRQPILSDNTDFGPTPILRPATQYRDTGTRSEWLRGISVVRKHWRWSLAFALIVTVATAITVFRMTPVYEPLARIQVDPPGTETFSLQGTDTRTDPTEYLQTQTKALQGDGLALQVVRKYRLDQRPGFLPPTSNPGDQHLTPDPGASVAAQTDTAESDDLLPLVSNRETQALAKLRGGLHISLETGSRLIKISFASSDPRMAAFVTNAVVQEYIDSNYQAQHEAITRSTNWLSKQLDDIRLRMEQSSRVLADFQKKSGVMELGGSQSSFGEKISELNKQLALAQADRIQLQALLAKVRNDPTLAAQVNSEPVVQELEKRLRAAEVELSEASVIYGKNHPNVRKLQAEVDDLHQQLADKRNSIMSNIKTGYAAAQERETLLKSQLADNSEALTAVAEYDQLKKEAEANEALYNSLYSKIKEAGIAAESKSSNIRWLDHARVLTSPTRPQRRLLLLAGLLAGLLGGVLVAFIRESLDVRVHSLDDLRSSTGLTKVVVLPRTDTQLGLGARLRLLTQGGSANPETFLLDRPYSAESEALRALFTSVRLSFSGGAPRLLLIASSCPGEGKTTIAVNLSIALARMGTTCLVDADLRKPSVAGAFGVNFDKSLIDVLRDEAAEDEVLLPVPGVPNLAIIPGGHGCENASELIDSKQMASLLNELRHRFDFVLVDSVPVLPYADTRGLATLVDGIVFVSRSGVTTRDALQRSLELLAEVHSAPVIELVLNAVDMRSPEYRIHYGYGQQYGSYHPPRRA